MQIANYIRIIPVPYIKQIEEDGTIVLKTEISFIPFFTINNLDLSERHRRKNGNNYYEQKLTIKVDQKFAPDNLRQHLGMPCIVEIRTLDGEILHWGDMIYPVRTYRKSVGIGDEFKLERSSIQPFLI